MLVSLYLPTLWHFLSVSHSYYQSYFCLHILHFFINWRVENLYHLCFSAKFCPLTLQVPNERLNVYVYCIVNIFLWEAGLKASYRCNGTDSFSYPLSLYAHLKYKNNKINFHENFMLFVLTNLDFLFIKRKHKEQKKINLWSYICFKQSNSKIQMKNFKKITFLKNCDRLTKNILLLHK